MSMSRKDFVALADELRPAGVEGPVLLALIRFMRQQNGRFNEDRWMMYLRGECGPMGGKIKEVK